MNINTNMFLCYERKTCHFWHAPDFRVTHSLVKANKCYELIFKHGCSTIHSINFDLILHGCHMYAQNILPTITDDKIYIHIYIYRRNKWYEHIHMYMSIARNNVQNPFIFAYTIIIMITYIDINGWKQICIATCQNEDIYIYIFLSHFISLTIVGLTLLTYFVEREEVRPPGKGANGSNIWLGKHTYMHKNLSTLNPTDSVCESTRCPIWCQSNHISRNLYMYILYIYYIPI